MQKNAQKRGLLNELREKINMPGSYLDGFFKPELERVMNSLKSLDDRIRSELTGKKIGTGEAPAIQTSAKDLLKSARTNFNRREYMSGISDLGMFHKKMFDVTQDINKFFVDVNKIHHKFLFEGVDEDKVNKLREHMDRKAGIAPSPYFIKEAGIMDFFYNIGTKRGRGLAAWEKKYPKQTKDLREWGLKLVDDADALLANSISYLKEMATARATRRPDEYMDTANKIKAEFDKFDNGNKGFKAYYNTVVSPFLKIKDEIDSKDKPSQQDVVTNPNVGKTELGTEPTTPSPDGGGSPSPTLAPPVPTQPSGPPQAQMSLPFSAPPAVSPPSAPPVDTAPDTLKEPPKVRVAPQEEPKIRVATHEKFYQSLEAMSGEDPRILAGFIAKYAKSIQESDTETAIKLFSIVKKLKG